MILVITGLPGAGKTTLLNEVSKNNGDLIIISFGSLMLEVAQKEFGIQHRDEMRKKLTAEQIEYLQELAVDRINEIEKENPDKIILVDTHASVKTPYGFMPGIHDIMLQKMKIKGFIYITTDHEEILERRRRDASRYRDLEDILHLRLHDNMNLAVLTACSIRIGSPVKIILNREGKLQEAVKELEELLNAWKQSS
ncbi:MAG: adenylate kinase [Candidatus Micrarchaeota archaeon]|nr:adenylate kinase [Candidatus Micrarchaeota archaeon]